MAKIDKLYHEILRAIKDTGYVYRTENRPDVEMKQVSSITFEHSLLELPIITTKEVFFKGVFAELIWFLRGDDNIKFLVDNGVNIWNEDAYNFYQNQYAAPLTQINSNEPFTLEDFVEAVKNGKGSIKGDVGRNYGVQWREWTKKPAIDYTLDTQDPDDYNAEYVDQMATMLRNLQKPNPINRRHIVTAWNPAELDQTALPPCHWSFEVLPRPMSTQQKMMYSGQDHEYLDSLWNQAYVKNDKEALSTLNKELAHVPDYGFTLKWHQRSVDTFLGLPFNIASYAVLSHIIGALTGMIPLSIIGDLSNVHVYGNHWDAVNKQLGNNPSAFAAPKLKVSEHFNIMADAFRNGNMTFGAFAEELMIDDIQIEEYNSFGKISAKMVAPIE